MRHTPATRGQSAGCYWRGRPASCPNIESRSRAENERAILDRCSANKHARTGWGSRAVGSPHLKPPAA
eukprot:scaffold669_cov152-Isochrysis_galbana.AAC.2